MRTRTEKRIALAAALLAWACGGGTAQQRALAPALKERTFSSESVTGRQLVAGTNIRLTFGDTELSVNAGCNHMFGRYRFEGDVLHMLEMGSTEMGCGAELHAQDEWIEQLLTGSPNVTFADPRVTLSTPEVRLTLLDRRVASPDRPLVSTRWIGNGVSDGVSMSFEPGATELATVTFGSDGRVEVFTACQRGTGTFSVEPGRISFSQLSYDGAACSKPELERVSKDVLLVLDGSAVSYHIREASMDIKRGERVLMFRADE